LKRTAILLGILFSLTWKVGILGRKVNASKSPEVPVVTFVLSDDTLKGTKKYKYQLKLNRELVYKTIND